MRLDAFAADAQRVSDLLVGHPLLAAHHKTFLPLRRELFDGFVNERETGFLRIGIREAMTLFSRHFFKLRAVRLFGSEFAQGGDGAVARHDKQVIRKAMDGRKRFAGLPDFDKDVLHNFLGQGAGLDDGKDMGAQLLVPALEQFGECCFLSRRHAVEQLPFFVCC